MVHKRIHNDTSVDFFADFEISFARANSFICMVNGPKLYKMLFQPVKTPHGFFTPRHLHPFSFLFIHCRQRLSHKVTLWAGDQTSILPLKNRQTHWYQISSMSSFLVLVSYLEDRCTLLLLYWQMSIFIQGIFQEHSALLPSVSHSNDMLAVRRWQNRHHILHHSNLLLVYMINLVNYSSLLWTFDFNFPSFFLVQAVEEFLSEVRSREQPHSAGLVSQPTAVKFLMARKFDVTRAIDLFQAYKVQPCF